MPQLTLPTVTLHYELHGAPDSAPLLLLHGATETFRSTWSRQIEPLSRHYRLIGPDLRGHGRSTNPLDELDLRVMADDVVALLDHLGVRRAHVCGFSGGGSVALFMALRRLDRLQSLILISNNYELDQARTGHVDVWNPERIRLEEPRWWAAMERMHQVEIPRLLGWWAAEDRLRPNFHASDLVGLWVPALIIGGDRDRVVPLEQTIGLYQALPDAQLAILPGIGHGVPTRRAELFNEVVTTFLARQRVPLEQMVRTVQPAEPRNVEEEAAP